MENLVYLTCAKIVWHLVLHVRQLVFVLFVWGDNSPIEGLVSLPARQIFLFLRGQTVLSVILPVERVKAPRHNAHHAKEFRFCLTKSALILVQMDQQLLALTHQYV